MFMHCETDPSVYSVLSVLVYVVCLCLSANMLVRVRAHSGLGPVAGIYNPAVRAWLQSDRGNVVKDFCGIFNVCY